MTSQSLQNSTDKVNEFACHVLNESCTTVTNTAAKTTHTIKLSCLVTSAVHEYLSIYNVWYNYSVLSVQTVVLIQLCDTSYQEC